MIRPLPPYPLAVARVVLTLALLGSPTKGRAECALPAGAQPALGEFAATQRLEFLQHSLQATARHERRFALAWSLSYVGLATSAWVLVPLSSDPQGQRISSAWSSATSLTAAVVAIIDPLRAIADQRRLDRLLAQSPARPARCALLAEAERLLTHAAANEQTARGARAHLFGFFTTVGLGLIHGYVLQRPESAATSTLIGTLLGQFMIGTRPTTAIRRLESYRLGELSESAPPAPTRSVGATVNSLGHSYGVALAGVF